jgi:general secretion pathway protein L
LAFQSSLGIYFSDKSVTFAYYKSSFRRRKLAAQEAIQTIPGQTFRERVSSVSEKIAEFIKSHRIPSSEVYIGIPRELAIVKELFFPAAVKENLKATLRYEMEKYIPLSPDEVYFDFQIIDEDKALNQIKIMLVVVKKEIIDSCIDLKDRIGVGISGIEISATAICNYIFADQNPKFNGEANGFAHLQNEVLEIGIVENRQLCCSRSVKVDLQQEDLSSILINEIEPALEVSGLKTSPLHIIFNGPPRYFESLEQNASDDFQVSSLNLTDSGILSHEMIVSLGTALKGFEKVSMDINLLPVIHRKRPSRLAYYVMFVLLALTILSGLLWGGSKIMRERMVLTQLNSEMERVLSETKKIDQIRDELKTLENQIGYIESLVKKRVPILDVLLEISERLPDTAWIQDFRYSEKGGQIYGFADSASELIQLLEASPLFKEVIFLSTITKRKDGKERFRIGFKLNP